ncbi:MAG: NAD(P)/FAD-dependent oxidoreductase [bacterium]|nr:NAD(P)/FAD-dependent oxidoreductase [bacterium]
MRDTDVLVVGGGPAGLATAIASRLEGLDALVVERRRPPIDKACGEGLMPDGLERLRRLGVELDPARQSPFRGIRYIDGDTVAEGRFPGVNGAGVRRLDLHRALAARAEEVGVDLRWGTRVEALTGTGVETDSGSLSARWIVGADGLRSRLRAWAGLDAPPARRQRFGVRRHFSVAPWSDCVEVYWADDCEAYVTPVAADEVGVAMLWSPPKGGKRNTVGRKAGFDQLMASFPRLAESLAGAPAASKDRGCGPLRQRVKGVTRGRLALVGDASGYVDAITGEGLSLAFHQAGALAEAMKAGDLRLYARAHRHIAAVPDAMTRLLLWIERRPALRRRVIRALAREPTVFSRLLAIHCRALPVRRLGIETAPRLLWRMVQP